MAIGDVTQKKLLQKALSTTATDSQVTGSATKLTTITSITLTNTNATTARKVYPFIYGTAVVNRLPTITLAADGGGSILTGLDYVLAAGETLSFSQDVGTDVTVTVIGIEEVIS